MSSYKEACLSSSETWFTLKVPWSGWGVYLYSGADTGQPSGSLASACFIRCAGWLNTFARSTHTLAADSGTLSHVRRTLSPRWVVDHLPTLATVSWTLHDVRRTLFVTFLTLIGWPKMSFHANIWLLYFARKYDISLKNMVLFCTSAMVRWFAGSFLFCIIYTTTVY